MKWAYMTVGKLSQSNVNSERKLCVPLCFWISRHSSWHFTAAVCRSTPCNWSSRPIGRSLDWNINTVWPEDTEWFIVTRYSVFHAYSCQGDPRSQDTGLSIAKGYRVIHFERVRVIFFFWPKFWTEQFLVCFLNSYPTQMSHFISSGLVAVKFRYKHYHTNLFEPKTTLTQFFGANIFLLICPWEPYFSTQSFSGPTFLLLTYMFLRPHFFVNLHFCWTQIFHTNFCWELHFFDPHLLGPISILVTIFLAPTELKKCKIPSVRPAYSSISVL